MQCNKWIKSHQTTVTDLKQLLQKLSFPAQAAVLLNRLHQRYLQQFQILALRELSNHSKITLDNE